MVALALIGFGFLCGSLPFGVWLARLGGVNVQQAGSGNIGATNVARTAGLRLGALTLLADISKGAAPVGLALAVPAQLWVAELSGLAAFLGHLYSPLLRGRGGKGVATAVGVFAVLAPWAVLAATLIFAAVAAATRLVSLASIVAATALAVACLALYPPHTALLATFVAALIVWRHRSNIGRLRAGSEPRFGAPR
jgi:glycerol-3-phosphate acyltransferase PlsY